MTVWIRGVLVLLLAGACAGPRNISSPSPTPSPTPREVMVIGDSVFVGIKSRLESGELPDVSYARNWEITARSGFGWGASSPSWPLSVIRGSWVVDTAEQLLLRRPAFVVVSLGTNDALRAMFADALHHPHLADEIRSAVVANITQLLAETTRAGACAVLVTATTFPTTLFGGAGGYTSEAELVDSIIVSSARGRAGRAVVADWASYSAVHHMTQGDPGNWFPADGIHPNVRGDAALVGLVHRSMTQCHQAPR